MATIAPDTDEKDEEIEFVPLTAEQAQALREQHPSVSPWWVVAGQAVVGVLVTLITWWVTGKTSSAWSAAFGALAVVVPAALFARGISGRFASAHVGSAVLVFFVWEFVKIVMTVGVVLLAQRLVVNLSWPIMLLSLVITMKVYWVALIRRPQRKS